MPKYGRIAPRAYWLDDHGDAMQVVETVHVSEHEAVETGVLWADGSPVMRFPNPVGFGRDDEW